MKSELVDKDFEHFFELIMKANDSQLRALIDVLSYELNARHEREVQFINQRLIDEQNKKLMVGGNDGI